MQTGKIILASKSPRRSQLLQWAEIEFEVITADTDESYPPELLPAEIAMHIASNKANDVEKKVALSKGNGNGYPILAADTIVVLDNKIIGKPSGREDAIHTLSLLSGKKHLVITGVCILSGENNIVFAERTIVEFNSLTQIQIQHYVDNYKPYDKAGAYAIQEWIGVTGIKSINGDFYNVMGLPVSRVVQELVKL
ncbi:MAG: Maf family protein [Bacteroidota bacterium]|nr:Maf family protein [Bacteroidota bacterium]